MTFKLGALLDDSGDPNLTFKLYDAYIEYNRWRFPESALEVIAHPDWVGGSQSRAPYYSELNSLEIKDLGKVNAELRLTLIKDMYVETPLKILITYQGLFELDIPSTGRLSESTLQWRLEQFLYFDVYHTHKIKDKLFTHQIEWTNGSIWSITARNIGVEWQELLSDQK